MGYETRAEIIEQHRGPISQAFFGGRPRFLLLLLDSPASGACSEVALAGSSVFALGGRPRLRLAGG